MTENGNLYIYCVAQSTPDTDNTPDRDYIHSIQGHLNAPVFGISRGDFTAYVSVIPLSSLEVTYENLRRHEDVISGVMKKHEVLPMSYSTVSGSKEAVVQMLEKYAAQFKENLERIKGKVELGFKVFYKLNIETAEKSPPETTRTDISPKEYIMRMYERYQKNQRLTDVPLSAVNGFHGILSAIACESSFTKPLKNNLIFNGSYLVRKEDKTVFDKSVDDIITLNREYKIVYSGPWPAYHFINIVSV